MTERPSVARYRGGVSEAEPGPMLTVLDRITAALANSETRPGQRDMARAVSDAIDHARHLIVEAGTGTGKSLAYLVPAIMSGKTTVVATATKALQDQLAGKDLPFLIDHLDKPVTFAVLKGRSNYVCRQRLHELTKTDKDPQLSLDGLAERAPAAELAELAAWAAHSPTGDRAELAHEPSAAAWAAVSVSARECPGASRCPSGDSCFAEAARRSAADADIIIVNQHLYGLHVASGGTLLPDHDVVVIDEAHQLIDVVSSTSGLDLAASRFTTVTRAVKAILDDPTTLGALDAIAVDWDRTLGPEVGRRLKSGMGAELADLVTLATARVDRLAAAVRGIDPKDNADVKTRRERALKLASSLLEDLQFVTSPPSSSVMWIEGPASRPSLRLAPLDVAELLAQGAWLDTVAVLTSATIPAGLAESVGMEPDKIDQLDVGSPFDYAEHALLYCPFDFPDPRNPAFEAAMHDDLEALITAAGGATLALFTSFRSMDAAVEALRQRLDVPILSQRDRPKPALIDEFTNDHATCLFATMGFWQGVDVPGSTLSLVTIDRLPFPRPDDPLLQARRELYRQDAFRVIDLPRAATMLAQGVGRLIRSSTDRGVVAVFDSRLATSRNYRWDLVRALPPMSRTRDRTDAEKFLREIADAG